MQKVDRKLVVHRVRITDGEFTEGAAVLAKVDPEWRLGARQAHSGTHVVHAALRQVLGPEALQSGSYNKPGYLRLDFAWDQALSAATRSEIEEVANRAVRQDLPVRVLYGSHAEAQAMGAIALFGETYDDTVRIVEIGGPWSVELCGGTHVEHSSQIGPVAITGESSVGSGLRRVEAARRHRGVPAGWPPSGPWSAELAGSLKVQPSELPGRIEALLERLRVAEKELPGCAPRRWPRRRRRWRRARSTSAESRWSPRTAPDGHRRPGDLRNLATDVRGRLGGRPGVVALFAPGPGPVAFAVAVTQAAIAAGLAAGDLAKTFLPAIEGRGGGQEGHGAGRRDRSGRHSGGDRGPARRVLRRGLTSRRDNPDQVRYVHVRGMPRGRSQAIRIDSMQWHEFRRTVRTRPVTHAGKACVWGSTSVRFAWGSR